MNHVMHFNGLQFTQVKKPLASGHAGFFKKTKRGWLLYEPNGELDAYLVDNDEQGQFAVSARLHGTRVRYCFSTCSLTEKWLGLADMSLAAIADAIKAIRVERAKNN